MRMERVEYEVRASLLHKTRTFRLSEHELELQDEGNAPVRIELASITEVRLLYQPSRAEPNRFACEFTAAGKKYRFISMHFRGLLDFEDRAARYGAFCRELCARVARRNPILRCVGGLSPLKFYAALGLGVLFLIAIVGLVLAFWDATLARSFRWLRVLVFVFLIIVLVQYFIANRPRQFDPAALPESALPKLP
jgi:hypothetical protein